MEEGSAPEDGGMRKGRAVPRVDIAPVVMIGYPFSKMIVVMNIILLYNRR